MRRRSIPAYAGDPYLGQAHQVHVRSIPAYAGDPHLPHHAKAGYAVYPRLRGGSHLRARSRRAAHGLSPPTRGIRPLTRRHPLPLRSIPAYAGDPHGGSIGLSNLKVYPRLRGGSGAMRPEPSRISGLSPPTRGILMIFILATLFGRSIPAYAGDPSRTQDAARS